MRTQKHGRRKRQHSQSFSKLSHDSQRFTKFFRVSTRPSNLLTDSESIWQIFRGRGRDQGRARQGRARRGKAGQDRATRQRARQLDNWIWTSFMVQPKQHKAKQAKAGQSKAKQGKARQGNGKQGRTRQGNAKQSKAWQGSAKQGNPDKAKQHDRGQGNLTRAL